MNKEKLILIGNGMAGVRTVEELLKLSPEAYDITVFGAEPYGNYNRIMLSPVLAGEKTIDQIMLNDEQCMSTTASPCIKARMSSISIAAARSCARKMAPRRVMTG